MQEEQFPYNTIFSEIGTVNTLHSTKLNWSIQCARKETILSSPLITDVWTCIGMYKQQRQVHTMIQFDLDCPVQSIALLSFTRRINCFWQIWSSY